MGRKPAVTSTAMALGSCLLASSRRRWRDVPCLSRALASLCRLLPTSRADTMWSSVASAELLSMFSTSSLETTGARSGSPAGFFGVSPFAATSASYSRLSMSGISREPTA